MKTRPLKYKMPAPIYSNFGKVESSDIEKNPDINNSPMHALYYIEGEYPFGKLNLIRYGYNKIHSINEEIQVLASKQDNKVHKLSDEDYKKNLIFENKIVNGLIVMSLNTKSHYHEIDITARKNKKENPGIIKEAINMLERELGFGCKLKDRENILSNLANKFGLESN